MKIREIVFVMIQLRYKVRVLLYLVIVVIKWQIKGYVKKIIAYVF